MNCIICNSIMEHYFTKQFDAYGLGEVEYERCTLCGFSASATHFALSEEQWEALNGNFHSDSFARTDNPYNRNQRYFNQALMLHLLHRNQIIPNGDWLDWGSGSGSLSMQLDRHFGLRINNFDQYMEPQLFSLERESLLPGGYQVVVNTAVFEHVRSRRTLDEIESYVAPGGCLCIHTLVRGEIPADPEWMYLLPVHCAFHTNTSMNSLMQQWGYSCSVYNEHAKMWIWFKEDAEIIADKVSRINRSMGWEYLHFKHGFMDFWP
ncbi:MAG: class I SAM-dependent methyltransferase [Alphaproteobacteria bacterium]|nr:MAG: class I SAM-dependent methyltransferase [Alphaproteobacteria bacterium]